MDTRLCSFSRRALVLATAASLAACAQTTPRWDSTFGNSVRSTFAAQIANPGAARNTDPVAGIDGRAARTAQEKYERGAAEAEPAAAPVSLMSGSVTR